MKKIYLPLIALLFSASAFAQKSDAVQNDDARLNQLITVMMEQNELLKEENNMLRTMASSNVRPSKASASSSVPAANALREMAEQNMVFVEGGVFVMGCSDEKDTSCYHWEKPAHSVMLNDFYLAKYPVTQKEWKAVMNTHPWFSKDCDNCPVENVSWEDAQEFIQKLNAASGKKYRLPTEAEWEYAAKGGTDSKGYKYAGSNYAERVAWFDNNSGKSTHPVGQKIPNELGLYDMSGNVWQWCSDWFNEEYYKSTDVENPQGPVKEDFRVCRGGSWWSDMHNCRVSNRDRYPADAKDDDVGFRLARD